MVSFSCEVCNDTVIKKKLDQHTQRCRGAYFTCIDCSKTFNGTEYRSHTQCISEAEKYEKSLYKGRNPAKNPRSKALDKSSNTPSSSKPVPEKTSPSCQAEKTKKAASNKVKKSDKKSAIDLSNYSNGSLYQVIKSISKDAKTNKKSLMKKMKVEVVGDTLVLTL